MPEACNFIKKETLAQVFSYEFCEISKNTFSYRTPPVAASAFFCFTKRWYSVISFTAWKVSKYGVFSGPRFSVFGLNTEKYGPEKTPYLDSFHSVLFTKQLHIFITSFFPISNMSCSFHDCFRYIMFNERWFARK